MKTIVSIAAALTLLACAAKADTAENYNKLCASCHGADGVGKTKAGKKLEIKDLTDGAYQKGFTDQQAFDSLKGGLKSKEGDNKMKPFNEKLTDPEIWDLVKYVRTLAK